VRCQSPSRVVRRTVLLGGLVALAALATAAPALASPDTASSYAPPIAGLLDGIGDALLGGVDWTVNVAGDFVMNLLGGIVEKLIPRSWIHKGLEILSWLVAVPSYSGRVSSPGGGSHYGFAGVNAMRELYTWLGMAIAPLTLLYATSRSWSGQGDPPSVPLTRFLLVAVALLNYTWLWSQAVALTNQITHAILGINAVSSGIEKMFEVLIAGSALGHLPLIGILLMGFGGLQLIALIFVKVVLILVGALVFATGPLMIGVVPTDRGHALSRAWMTIALGLFVLPILWASLFAIAAVLINDAFSGAAVLAGGSGIGRVFSGLVIALAAIAGFWLAIKLTKAFGSLVGGQLAGLLALAGGGARALLGGAGRVASGVASGAAGAGASAATSLRGFGAKVGAALVPAGGAAPVFAGAGGAAAALGRGGALGAGASLASKGAASTAGGTAGGAAASTRAGAVATRAARLHGSSATRPPSADGASTSPTGASSAADAASTAATTAAGRPPTAGSSSSAASASSRSGNANQHSRTPDPGQAAATSANAGASSRPADQGRPGGRTPTGPRLASPTPRPPSTASSPPANRPRLSGGVADDAANETARRAFGGPPPAKPTRTLRRPLRGPRQ
jgi:hypothetical protein